MACVVFNNHTDQGRFLVVETLLIVGVCILSFSLNRDPKRMALSYTWWVFYGFFCPKQGQGFKHSGATLFPNIGQVSLSPGNIT